MKTLATVRGEFARAVAISAALSAAMTMVATSASASPAHRMFLLANLHTCDFQLVTTQLGRASAEAGDGRRVGTADSQAGPIAQVDAVAPATRATAPA